jgi:hypothetical protein
MGYHDRSGTPITGEQWSRRHADRAYVRIAATTITDTADPAHTLTVSTVWLGIDHGFSVDVLLPLIFETMVFGDDALELDCHRYCTEPQARSGHAAMVSLICATFDDPVTMNRNPL